MKKAFKVVTYLAVILTITAIYLRLERGKDSNALIKALEKQNDSLQVHIDSNAVKIEELNVMAEGYRIQIEQDKAKLADLQAKLDFYKRKYNEETSRITKLTGDSLISEFTNAFD